MTSKALTWDLYLAEALPSLLNEAGLKSSDTAATVADIGQRAHDFIRGGTTSRCVLRVPFFDDVAEFSPHEAPVGVRAEAAVVVRNSILENAHANDVLDDETLTTVTYLATGAFNHWAQRHYETSDDVPAAGVYATIAEYPRAYAALQALAIATENGAERHFGCQTAQKSCFQQQSPTTRQMTLCDALRSPLSITSFWEIWNTWQPEKLR